MDLIPLELWFWIPGALVGFWILRRSGTAAARLFGTLVMLGIVAYFVPDLPVHKGRFLPYAFWSIHVLGGIGIGSLLVEARTKRSWPLGLAGSGALGMVIALFLLRSPAIVREVASDQFTGTESKAGWADFQAIMATLSGESQSRVFSEDSESLAEIGSALAFALVPYWTGNRAATLGGLWQESSLGNPFITRVRGSVSPDPIVSISRGHPGPLNFELGVRQLQLYGVSRFVTVTEAGAMLANGHPDLHLLTEEGRFRLYGMDETHLVEVAEFQPSVYAGGDRDCAFLEWFERSELFSHWLVSDGPPAWPRVSELPDTAGAMPYPDAHRETWDVSIERDRIAFRTRALGIPHLVKVSYFPDWRVEGGDGPFLAAPSLMVVIPREEQVVLKFSRGWVEAAGFGLSWVTLLTLGGSALLQRRKSATRIPR
jgi:hypothetical protein